MESNQMEAVDDMHDFYDVDELVEHFDGGDDTTVDFDDHQQNYTVLSEDDIRRCQEEEITKISTVLDISEAEASVLLRHYNWSVTKVQDEWFVDETKVRQAVGLLEGPVVGFSNATKMTCGICTENFPMSMMSSTACGHLFCNSCWAGYIATAINDGPGCLLLRCPDASCSAAVCHDLINNVASKEDKEKYDRHFLRSYIECNKKAKWCPAPGCDYAVTFVVGCGNYDVTCRCSHIFCWNCTEEAHRPVDCHTVAKWIMKNSAESENMNWLLANTKPCPKCKRSIEKLDGCVPTTCTPCNFQFCWLCLGAWVKHGDKTMGGYLACNHYEAAKQEGGYDEAKIHGEMADNSLERDIHYHERWAINHWSRQRALADLHQMQNVHLETLSCIQGLPKSQLKFIIEAWLQIVECRGVLKWTYVYGYYLAEHEDAKIQLFEYLQGAAEVGLERLHLCAKQELQVYLNSERMSIQFNDFRTKLADLTGVTRKYFHNLVQALENGLSDMDSRCETSQLKRLKSGEQSRIGSGRSNISSVKSASSSVDVDGSSYWPCKHCTFANVMSAMVCHLCHNRRMEFEDDVHDSNKIHSVEDFNYYTLLAFDNSDDDDDDTAGDADHECAEEAHRPVDCDTVAMWLRASNAEFENMNRILLNTKPCPKCKRPTEKTDGCMSIMCTPCDFEFCWLCLGSWTEHGETVDGFIACDRYKTAKQKGVYDETKKCGDMTEERDPHYHEHWAINHWSRQKALEHLHQMQKSYLEKLSNKQYQPESHLKLIIKAWSQIIKCRGVLKWTHVYGYYLPIREHVKEQFFEYLQGEAEACLERLQHCAEELLVYLSSESLPREFHEFRTNLAVLTSVTRNYFNNLVQALENVLLDVDLHGAIYQIFSFKSPRGRLNVYYSGHWACQQCTFVNYCYTTVCQICHHRNGPFSLP